MTAKTKNLEQLDDMELVDEGSPTLHRVENLVLRGESSDSIALLLV